MTVIASNAESKPVAGSLHGWLLVATCWLAAAGAVLIAPVLPFMQKDYAALPNGELLTMIVLVVPALMIALCSPLVGSLVDLFGRKRIYMIAVTIYAIAGVLPFWLTDIYAIIASRVVVGATEAAITTIATALTADYFTGAAREKWLTIQTASASMIAVVMFALGGALGGLASGWRTPFLVYGCAILFLPLIGLLLWEPEETVDPDSGLLVSSLPFPWRAIGHVCLINIFASIMFFVVTVQISFLLVARGAVTPEVIGIGSAIANVGVPVGSYIFSRLAKWQIIRLLVVAFALLALGFYVIVAFNSVNATIAGAFIACLGGGIGLPLLLTWVMARLPFAQRGRGAGGFMGTFFLGNFLSPLIVAGVAANAGGLVPAIGWFSAACAVAAVISLLLQLAKLGPTESVQTVDMHMPLPH
ncbi:MAG: MFS transporter [Xanthobacteraceae bacterium]